MKANLQKATPHDIPVLNKISVAAKMHWGYPQEWIEKWKPDLYMKEEDFSQQMVYKLLVAQQVIGFCAIAEEDTFYEVMHLWVKPTFIGEGYGKQLLSETLSQVATTPKDILVEADPNAEAFYAKQGFVTFDKVESYPKGRYLPVMRKQGKES